MDPADLDEVPEPDNKTQGLNLAPRLNFVPPPELPTPETASIQARASLGHRCTGLACGLPPADDPLWRHQLVERALVDQDRRPPRSWRRSCGWRT